jgi:signal transduction histidine kinase
MAVAGLVTEVFAELEMAAAARKVQLVHDLSVATAAVDADLVRRMLANLVENAVRHAKQGTVVTVMASKSDDGLLFRVTDRGTGVPLEMRDKVFDPFVQLDEGAAPPSRSGRGLGLAFCKLVADAHGGRIWIEDAEPGATFCVVLPARAEP